MGTFKCLWWSKHDTCALEGGEEEWPLVLRGVESREVDWQGVPWSNRKEHFQWDPSGCDPVKAVSS